MKAKILYVLTTSALVMSAFLIGKTMSTQYRKINLKALSRKKKLLIYLIKVLNLQIL